MLNDLMWILFAYLAVLSIFVVPMVALVWVTNVIVKALKHRHARGRDDATPAAGAWADLLRPPAGAEPG
jgi:hypothetical protein